MRSSSTLSPVWTMSSVHSSVGGSLEALDEETTWDFGSRLDESELGYALSMVIYMKYGELLQLQVSIVVMFVCFIYGTS